MTAAQLSARLLFRKDSLELWRDRRLLTAIVLVVALAVAAIAATYVRASEYERDRAAATALDRTSWLAQGARDPHGAAHFSQWAFRPLRAPALLDPGTLPHVGSAIWMEAHARNPPAFRPIEDRLASLDLGEFSAAWVLQTVAPLLVLVLAAGAVARERERGTLRLMLASGLPAGTLVGAKARGLARIGALILVPLLAVAAAAAALAPEPPSTEDLVRIMLWCAVHAVYLLIAVGVGVAMSARARAVAPALLALIALWLVAVPLAPRAAAGLAETLYPTPSGARFWTQIQADIRDGVDGSGSAEERRAAFETQVLRRYGVARTADLPVNFRGLTLEEGERFGNRVFDRRFAELEASYRRQRDVMRIASVLTPVVAVQNLSMALAGTDNVHAQDFARQAEAERRSVVTRLNRDVLVNGVGQTAYRADDRLWRTFRPFDPVPTSIQPALAASWPDALILAAWLALSILLVSRAGRALGRELG